MALAFYTLDLCFALALHGIDANSFTAAAMGRKTPQEDFPISQNVSGPPLCPVLLVPPCGSFHVSGGTGRDVGSIALFQCREGYQLLGRGKLRCLRKGDGLQWSHPEPQCKVSTHTPHRGLRLAAVISLVSCFIVFTIFVSFTVCCVQERRLSLQGPGVPDGSCDERGFFMKTEEKREELRH